MAGLRPAFLPWSKLDRVRRKTGKEQRVQVPYSEGVANHAGPESCAVHREVFGEALTGVRAGQPLSRERISSPGADAVRFAEGYMVARAIASARPTRRGRRTWHARTLLERPRRPPKLLRLWPPKLLHPAGVI